MGVEETQGGCEMAEVKLVDKIDNEHDDTWAPIGDGAYVRITPEEIECNS